MADDPFFNEATHEALRDLLNPKAARAKMIARAEAASAERQKVAASLAGSALTAAGYAPPKQAKPKQTVESLTETFSKLTPGQRKTISDALFTAEAAAEEDFPVSAADATAGFDAEGAWPLEEDDDEDEDY